MCVNGVFATFTIYPNPLQMSLENETLFENGFNGFFSLLTLKGSRCFSPIGS